MTSTVAWRAVLRGVGAGAVMLLAGRALSALFGPDASDGGWAWLFLAVALASFALAGAVAGGARSDRPMLHGVLAAGLVWLLIQTAGLAQLWRDEQELAIGAVAVTGLLALTCGVAGALAADWVRRRRRRRGEEAPQPEASTGGWHS